MVRAPPGRRRHPEHAAIGSPAQPVQHLRQLRLHAGALARGHDHDVECHAIEKRPVESAWCWPCCGVADRLQHAARGLRHRAHAGLVVDRRLWRLQPASRPRASRTASGRGSTGIVRPNCPTTPRGWPARAPRSADSITPAQVCRLVGRGAPPARPGHRPRPADRRRLGARADRGAVPHLEQRYAKASTRCAATSCSPTRPNATRRRSSARWNAWSDLRPARRSAAQADRRRHQGLALRPRGLAGRAPAPPARHVQTLRRLVAEKADRDRVWPRLRALAERTERSPDPAYRAYQQRLTDYNCGFAARIHNAMTPAQRQASARPLKGWEDDLRALATAAPVAALAAGSTVTPRGLSAGRGKSASAASNIAASGGRRRGDCRRWLARVSYSGLPLAGRAAAAPPRARSAAIHLQLPATQVRADPGPVAVATEAAAPPQRVVPGRAHLRVKRAPSCTSTSGSCPAAAGTKPAFSSAGRAAASSAIGLLRPAPAARAGARRHSCRRAAGRPVAEAADIAGDGVHAGAAGQQRGRSSGAGSGTQSRSCVLRRQAAGSAGSAPPPPAAAHRFVVVEGLVAAGSATPRGLDRLKG
jgi:hypothetical protein